MRYREGRLTLGFALVALSVAAGCVSDAPEVSGVNNPVIDAGGDSGLAPDGGTAGDAESTEDAADSGGATGSLTLAFHSEQSGETVYRWAPIVPTVLDDSGAEIACDAIELTALSGEIEQGPGPGPEVRVLTESATIGGVCTRGGEATELIATTIDTIRLPAALPDAWLMAHYQYQANLDESVWTDAIGGATWSKNPDVSAPSLVQPMPAQFPTLSFAGGAALFLDSGFDFESNDLTITWVGSYDPTRSKSIWFATCLEGNQQVYNLGDKLTFEDGQAGESVEAAQAGITDSVPRTIRFARGASDTIEISGWVDGTARRSGSVQNFRVILRDIGGRCTSPRGEWLLGTMSEVLIHESALPGQEIELLHGYLAEKYR